MTETEWKLLQIIKLQRFEEAFSNLGAVIAWDEALMLSIHSTTLPTPAFVRTL